VISRSHALTTCNFGDGQINAYAKLPNGQFEHRTGRSNL